MTRAAETSYIAECFWSGVGEADLVDLDRRIERSAAESTGAGDPVRYLGSMLIVDDEVVLCLFEGPLTTVRLVAERAGVPFDRILRSTGVPWSPPTPDPGS